LTAAGRRPRSWQSLLLPALLVFAVLIGLGCWQIERKAWKEALIASLSERLAAPPEALPSAADWPNLITANDEYRRFSFSGQFDYAKEALVYGAASAFRPEISGPGYWSFTPVRLADGSAVVVNRGFVPEAMRDRAARAAGEVAGPVAIMGAMRFADARHWFTPNDDATHNLWFSRDPQAIAAAKGLGAVAPFYIEQEMPVPPGGVPRPGKIVVNLPNNHLQYVVTWFGLAAALAGVFIVFAARGRSRGAAGFAGRPEHPSHSL